MHEPPKSTERGDIDVAETPRGKVSPLVRFIGSGFYSGYSPFVSGTVGSIVGLAIYAIPSFEHNAVLLPVSVFFFFLGVFTAGKMEAVYGHDPSVVTIDEVVGMWVSLFFLPKNILIALSAFVLFRIFDIFKPWPASVFDKKHGGFGIMMDDVFAGVYANIALQLGILLFR
jgi:phosphatidylglycerophosphatase A